MGVEYALYNNKGENVCAKHVAGHHSDVDAHSLAEYYKQTKVGNGPLTYRIQENPLMPFLQQCCGSSAYFDRPFADDFWNNLFFNAFSQATSNEVVPGLVAEFAGLRAPFPPRSWCAAPVWPTPSTVDASPARVQLPTLPDTTTVRFPRPISTRRTRTS